MSTREHNSPNVQTQSTERTKLEAKPSSASGSIEQDAQAGSQLTPTNGAILHRCEYCQDLVFDFDQSDDDIVRIVRSIVNDEELWDRYIARVLEWKGDTLAYGMRAVLALTTDQLLSGARNGCKIFECLLQDREVTGREDTILGVNLVSSESSVYFEIILYRSILTVGISLYVPEDSPLAVTIRERPINIDTWSDSSKSQIRHWMKHCNDTHILCDSENHDFRPSNLIEMSKNSTGVAGFSLRLTHIFKDIPRYAALSYCWGGDQPLKTQKCNIDAFRQEIPYEKMPATLQDAARVAFNLGFRYLWIDALCLVQDLGADEVHTLIAEIPEVYRYASLTIAAYSSSKSDEGFLHRRDIREIPETRDTSLLNGGHYEVQVRIENLGGDSGPAMLKLYLHDTIRASINLRGWTLQERLLSKAYLLFSDLFTEWICHEGCNREKRTIDGFSAHWHKDDEASMKKLLHQWVNRKDPGPHGTPVNHKAWHLAVNAYTQRSLSTVKDVPIAISALAKDFGEAYDYAAGLWLSNLCEDLCWTTRYVTKIDVKVDNAFHAPTWSWWSLPADATYPDFEDTRHDARFRLLDHMVKLAHFSAPFGYISEASLSLEARCGRVTIPWDVSTSRDFNGDILYGISGKLHFGKFTLTNIRFDCLKSAHIGRLNSFWIIPLIWKSDIPRYSLVVSNVRVEPSKKRHYYRVGFLHIINSPFVDSDTLRINQENLEFASWLKAQPVETFTLV